jgi:hypothetical protein
MTGAVVIAVREVVGLSCFSSKMYSGSPNESRRSTVLAESSVGNTMLVLECSERLGSFRTVSHVNNSESMLMP